MENTPLIVKCGQNTFKEVRSDFRTIKENVKNFQYYSAGANCKKFAFFYQKNVCHSGSEIEKTFSTFMVFKIVFHGCRSRYKYKYVTCLSTQQIHFGKYLEFVECR